MVSRYIFSISVGATAAHAYSAEVLIFSLQHFGRVSSTDIQVVYPKTASTAFKQFIKEHGFERVEIEHDGAQNELLLSHVRLWEQRFATEQPSHLVVLNSLLFALRPLTVPDTEHMWVSRISVDSAPCILFVPSAQLTTVKKWLADTPLAAFEKCEGAKRAPENWCVSPYKSNHAGQEQDKRHSNSFLLHHGSFNAFGLLPTPREIPKESLVQIQAANKAMIAKGYFQMLRFFCRAIAAKSAAVAPAAPLSLSSLLHEFFGEASHHAAHHTRRRLIIHGGLVKTGTTSLQTYLHSVAPQLKERGILYPTVYGDDTFTKHQWLARGAINPQSGELFNRFRAVLEQINDDIETVILSTEGIHNHWWDFAPEFRSFLKLICKYFNVELWLWFRPIVPFAEGIYCTLLRAPRYQAGPIYGRDLSPNECFSHPWLIKKFDYLGLIESCKEVFSDGQVKLFSYASDTVDSFRRALKIDDLPYTPRRENTRLSSAGTDIVRIINRYNLPPSEKMQAEEVVCKLDSILSTYSPPFQLTTTLREALENLTTLQIRVLCEEYGLELSHG